MSEKLDPEVVTGIMNSFFKVLTRPIYAYGGTVDKYIGDAIMALFGAPIAHEDDAERAVSAAWEMQIAAKEFATDLEARMGIKLRIRIGINTGLVVAGAVGGEQKRDYTVLGDAVNLASRLESNCRPGEIMVSAATQRLARRTFFFTGLEPIKVKGKTEPVEVFEVAGPRARVPEGEERPPFAGREPELAALGNAFESTRRATAEIALLVGEAGIGKSRLAAEFEKRATSAGASVLKARCFSYQQSTPNALVAQLLSVVAGPDPEPAALADLCAAAGLAEPELSARALGHLLGRSLDDAELSSLSAEQLQAYANRTLNAVLRQLARGSRIVLSLVDLHWLDSASAHWLASALMDFSSTGAPVFFLLQLRPEGESILKVPDTALRIRLGPLAESEGLAVIEGLLEAPATGKARELVDEALSRAEGNPFYLCEIVRSLTEQGILTREGVAWVARQRAGVALPATIQGTVVARVDVLPQPARQTLQVASVVGRRVPKTLLGEILDDRELEAKLGELIAAELVHVGAHDDIVFNQALIQEVVYEGLLVKTRKALHERVGLLLERSASDFRTLAPELAWHFQRAEDDPRASRYFVLSARQAADRFANLEARQAARGALEALSRLADRAGDQGAVPGCETDAAQDGGLPDRADVLLQLGDAESALGEYDAALSAYQEALGIATPENRPAVNRNIGAVLTQRGDYPAARAAFASALEAAPDARGRGVALGLLAAGAFRQADYPAAIALGEEAIACLDPSFDAIEVAKIESMWGLCAWRTGDLQGAEGHHRRALALREAARDIYGIGTSLTNLAQIGSELGHWRDALLLAQKALALYERIGDPQRIVAGAMTVGGLNMDLGEYAAASASLERGLELAIQIGHPLYTALCLGNLGDLETRRGRPAEAIPRLEEAVAILDRLGGKGHLAQASLLLGTALTRVGRQDDAWKALTCGLELAEATKEKATIGAACHRIAGFYLRAQKLDDALTWAGKGVAILQEARYQQELGHGYMQLADVCAALENVPMRNQARQRAVEIFEQIGAEFEARRAREQLSDEAISVHPT